MTKKRYLTPFQCVSLETCFSYDLWEILCFFGSRWMLRTNWLVKNQKRYHLPSWLIGWRAQQLHGAPQFRLALWWWCLPHLWIGGSVQLSSLSKKTSSECLLLISSLNFFSDEVVVVVGSDSILFTSFYTSVHHSVTDR